MNNPATAPTRTALHRRFAILISMLLLFAGLIIYWRMHPEPQDLLEQARTTIELDPIRSEELLRQAIDSSRGEFADAELLLVDSLGRQGRWKEVHQQWPRITLSSCSPELLLQFGRTAMFDHEELLGVAAWNEVRSRSSPERGEALELLAKYYRERQHVDELEKVLREQLALDPESGERWSDLITMLKMTHQETECYEVAKKALTHEWPREIRRYFELAVLDQQIVLGHSAEAWATFARLQEAEGDTLQLVSKKVDLYRMDGKMNEALQTIEEVFPQMPDTPLVYLARGSTYLDLGRPQEAVDDLKHVVEADPFNERAHYKLSEAYRSLKDMPRAQEHVQQGILIRDKRQRIIDLTKQWQASPGDLTVSQELVRLHRELGQEAEARQWEELSTEASTR